MTRLPLLTCPACAAEMTLDVLLGHAGARDALKAMAELDKSSRLARSAIAYVGLFAPPKQRLRMDRLAQLLQELAELFAPAKLEFRGRLLPAPREYWIEAMDEMTGPRREALTLPMKSHGYLKTIVAGYAEKAAAAGEARSEQQRSGRTQTGGLPPPPPPDAKPEPAPAKRFRMTDAHKQELAAALAGQPTKETNP